MIKFGPWVPDQPRLEGSIQEALNIRPSGERYKSLPRPSTISTSAVSGDPRGGFSSRNVGGSSKTYVGTATKLYERNGAGWTDVTGVTHTVADLDRWEFAQYADDIYACSGSITLQVQSGGSGNFGSVTVGPVANCISVVRQFVVVGDVTETGTDIPHKVRWCAIDDPSDWVISEATQAGSQELNSIDGKVMAIRGGEFGLILQQNAITRMSYVDAPIVWQFDKIDNRNGCEVSGSVVQVGRMVFFLSHDGFRVTDGSGESVNIGDGVVNDWFRVNLKASHKYKMRAAYNPEWRCVVWTFPSTASGDGSNDSVLLYSIEAKRWARGNYGAQLLWYGASSATTLDQLNNYFATLEDVSPPLDDPFWLGGEPVFLGMSGGLLCSFGAEAGTAVIETAEYEPAEGYKTRIKYVEPSIDSANVNIRVGSRQKLSDAVTYTPYAAVHSRTNRAPFRVVSRYQRVGIRVTGDFDDAVGFNVVSSRAGLQ